MPLIFQHSYDQHQSQKKFQFTLEIKSHQLCHMNTLALLPAKSLTADCQSVKRQPKHASHCQWPSAAAAFLLFFANATNIVANWVKKWHKVKEDSGNIFKIANIGKRKHNLETG